MNRSFAILQILLCLFWGGKSAITQDAITLSKDENTKKTYQCKPGLWGNLEYYYTFLEAPSWIMEPINTPSEKIIWSFPDKDVPQLRLFLAEAGLTEGNLDEIINASIPFQIGPPYRLFPPAEIVESLTSSSREKIAAELRKWPANHFYRSPVVIESGNVREWFKGSGLSAKSIALIEKLTYSIGHTTAFSDVPLVLSTMHSDAEERLLLKALTRTRSLILRLRIDPQTDLKSLQKYWSAGSKNNSISTIFEAIARTPGVDQIDAAHLLPPLPRKYLYTYPTLAMGVDGMFPDSYWTSLNFFNYFPEEGLSDPELVKNYYELNYIRSGLPFEFGDLLLLKDQQTGDTAHACVFVADDIVYTKNGRSLNQPFLLMKLKDLMARYGDTEGTRVEIWRKQDR